MNRLVQAIYNQTRSSLGLGSITNALERSLHSLASGNAIPSLGSVPLIAAESTPSATSIWNLWRPSYQLTTLRHASNGKLKPPFTGSKLKPYSAFKGRFKMTATGKIRYMRPGNVHKRFSKRRTQLQGLGETQVMHETYAKTMKRLGFVMRRF